jgi:hypothetical protein
MPNVPLEKTKAGAVEDYRRPYLLDTKDKVAWANNLRHSFGFIKKWKLGDHCPYRPR